MPNLTTQSTRVSAALPPTTGGAIPFKSAGNHIRQATRFIEIAPHFCYLTAAISLKSIHLHEETRIVWRLQGRGDASFGKVAQDASPDSERAPQPTEIEELNSGEDFTLTSRNLLTNEVVLVLGAPAALIQGHLRVGTQRARTVRHAAPHARRRDSIRSLTAMDFPTSPAACEDMTVPASQTAQRHFQAKIDGTEKGRVYVALPFDPADVWGARPRYHITGTINGMKIRGALEEAAKWHFLPLGAAWRRSAGLGPGDEVSVVLMAEGPQLEALAPDIAAALDAEPEAAQFFEGLASFYRKNYLRWIDATKRRPDIRAERIAELVKLLKAGHKQR